MRVEIRVVEGPDQGLRYSVDWRDRVLVGRSPECQLCLTVDRAFSRHHFVVEVDPPNVLLVDLGSTNGTFLGDSAERVTEAELTDGQQIRAGDTRFMVRIEPESTSGFHATIPDALPAPTALARPKQAPLRTPARMPVAPPPKAGPVTVRCLRCGEKAPHEQPRSRREEVAYLCPACQVGILDAPDMIPGYRILRELGRGGMGAVYLGLHHDLGMPRALKLILPKAGMTEKARDMFIREAREQAKLQHPNIVRVYDLQELAPGVFCMVMEYVEGVDAAKLLDDNGRPLEPARAVRIVCEALEGLAHAHAQGVVHRDIKDANLLVGKDWVKLSDFGLAKSYQTSGASGLTRTGELSGTLPYMAPEQILNFRGVQPPADLYSMGVTLYHLLTGELPLDFDCGLNPFVVILETPLIPLRMRDRQISPMLAAAVEKSLVKQAGDRYRNALAMREALLAAIR